MGILFWVLGSISNFPGGTRPWVNGEVDKSGER